jgi:hypothetical protein
VLPGGFQGVTAAPVKVPAGANEAKLVLTAPANAKPASNSNVVVRATATVNKINLTEETKVTLTIAKPGTPAAAAGKMKSVVLLPEGADGWKHLPTAQVKGDAWRALEFDEKGWRTDRAPLGYGEDEIARRKGTSLGEQGQPVVFRRTFDVPSELLAQKDVSFQLAVASDDSAVVYVNGQPADDDPEADHEFTYWNREVELPGKLLRPGRNMIAVLVKNKQGSSDLYFDLKVTVLVPVPKK